MTTDHYAEADSSLEQSFLTGEREDATLFALQAIAGATLALTDAVRALKAGATVTTTFAECDREWTALVDGRPIANPGTRARAVALRDHEIEQGGAAVIGWRPILPWTAEEAPRD